MTKRVYYRGYGYVDIPDGATDAQVWQILDAKKAASQPQPEQVEEANPEPRRLAGLQALLGGAARQVGSFIAAIPGAMINTAAAIPESIGALTAGNPDENPGPGMATSQGLHYLSDPALATAKWMRENPVSRYLSEVPADQKNPDGTPLIGRQIGDVAGQVGAMFVPGIGESKGARALSYLIGASQQASQVQQDADSKRAAGMQISPESSALAALLSTAGAGLDAFKINRIGRFLPAFAKHEALNKAAEIAGKGYLRPLAETVLSALGGAAVESGQQLISNAVIKGTYDPQQKLDEGLMDNAIAGGGADAGLEMITQMLLRKTAKNIHGRHQKVAERTRQTAPEITPGEEAAIGVRAGDTGAPEISYVAPQRPDRNQILDQLAVGVYGKPMSELDATRGMHLDRSYEELRKMKMSDEDVVSHLTQPIDLTAQPEQAPAPVAPEPPRLDRSAMPDVTLTPEGTLITQPQAEMSLLDRIVSQPAEDPEFKNLQGQSVIESMLKKRAKAEDLKTAEAAKVIPPISDVLPDATLTPEGTITTPGGPTEIRSEGVRNLPTRDQIIAEQTALRQQQAQARAIATQQAEAKAQRRAEADSIRAQKKQSQVAIPETGIPNERDIDARQRVSRELFGRNYDQLTPEQISEVSSYRAEGLGESVQPQEIAEVNEFADVPYSRDQYRSALEVGRNAAISKKPLIPAMIAKKANVTPQVANQILNHMVTRGDAQSVDGRVFVDPTAMGPRYSLNTEAEATPATPTLTVNSLRKQVEAGEKPKIALDVFSEMRRLGVDDIVSTRLVDTLSQKNANGKYADQVISLAMASQDPKLMLETLNHEAVHAMKELGLFNDTEWQILSGALNPNTVLSDEERRQYASIYGDRPEIMQEEAIARGLERYGAGELDLSGPAQAVVGQKLGVLDRLGNLFKSQNLQSPADVATAFREGKIGRREFNGMEVRSDNNIPDAKTSQRPVGDEGKGVVEDVPAQDVGTTDAPQAAKTVDPYSIGSLISDTDAEGFAAEVPDVKERLSVKQLPVNNPGSPIFAPPDERGALKRMIDRRTDATKNSPLIKNSDRAFLAPERLATRVEALDHRAAVEEMTNKLGHHPIESSIAATRNADQARTFAANSLESGPLEIKGNGPLHGSVGVKENGGRGPVAIYDEAVSKGKKDMLDHYRAAERASQLRPQGKEKLITPAQEAEWLKLGKDPDVKRLANELKSYNDQMIDFWLSSEDIDKATADRFKQGHYMSFYRHDPTSGEVAGQKSGSLTALPKIQSVEGSAQLIGDPLENMVRNMDMITSRAMNNIAKQRILRDGQKLGYAKQMTKGMDSKDQVHVNVKGKKASFAITDPLLYRSISATREPMEWWMKVLKFPTDVLRTAVTKTPVFAVRNIQRDSQHIHSLGYTKAPYMNLFTDVKKAYSDTGTMKKLEDMGVLSGSIQGDGGAVGTAQVIRNKIHDGDHALRRAWKTYSGMIDRSEAVNRITVLDHVYDREFKSAMKSNGGDAVKAKQMAEAAAQYETREVLNYGRHGANKWVQLLNATIPFQNARWQGVDVLYRALKEGRGLNPEQKKQAQLRLGMQFMLSTAYALGVAGTAAYESATEQERQDNYIIPLGEGNDSLKIPIAYEFGYISKIIPELAAQEMLKVAGGKDVAKAFGDFITNEMGAGKRFIISTAKVADFPQFLKPVLEAAINKDFFRDRDLEPAWMQKLNREYRYDDSTSEVAKSVAKYLPESSNLSPVKIDHILNGYLGTMGQYGTQLIDFMTSPDPVGKAADVKAIVEEGKYSKLPMFGSLFQRQDGAREMVDALEIRNKAERDAATLKMVMRQGSDVSDAEREKLRKGAGIAHATNSYDQRMAHLNKMMQQTQALMRAGQLTPTQGRQTLEEIRKRKIAISEPVVERFKDQTN